MWPEWTRGPWSEVRRTSESLRRGDRLGQQRRGEAEDERIG